jgi:hypothetical protein
VKRTLAITVAALLGCYALSLLARGLGIGPYWVEYDSPTGIHYACMYETKQDFITITLEETYRDQENHQD